MGKVDYYLNTFRYFRSFQPKITQGTVLDYGSNYGMFLDSSRGLFPQENYTGIDVDHEAIEEGKKLFPKANFIFYNGFNHMYNPTGSNCRPQLNQTFDTIISYSVLTHTNIDDTVETLNWLYGKLNAGGKMLISWLSIENKTAVDFFYNKRVRDFGSCDKIIADDYVYLLENKATKVPDIGLLLVFYRENYLRKLLTKYNYELVSAPSSTPDCFQNCIIIQK